MKLAEKIEAFKIKTPNCLEHTFKNGLIFKGSGTYKLHWWIDSIYKDAINRFIYELHTFKTIVKKGEEFIRFKIY